MSLQVVRLSVPECWSHPPVSCTGNPHQDRLHQILSIGVLHASSPRHVINNRLIDQYKLFPCLSVIRHAAVDSELRPEMQERFLFEATDSANGNGGILRLKPF